MNTKEDNWYKGIQLFIKDGRFNGSHNIHTPLPLVHEILDNIPNLEQHKSILVLFNLEFVISLLYNYNINSEKLFYYSDHPFKTKCAKALGVSVFTNLEQINMKFDVVVGNPPFQDTHRSGNPLWPLFIQKGFGMLNTDGIISMITPGRWVLPGHNIKKDKIRIWDKFISSNNTMLINLGKCSSYFSEGSSGDYFSYFVTQNSRTQSTTTVISNDSTFLIDLKGVTWLPYRNCNPISIEILKKISSKGHSSFDIVWKFDRSHTELQDTITKTHSFPVFIGKNQFKYSNHKSEFHNCSKILFKLGRFIPYIDRIFIDYQGDVSYNSAYVAQITQNENVDYLRSKLYVFIASCLWNGSEITAEGYRTLPRLPCGSWTDQELYDHFGLTQEEIDYIESQVK